MPVTYTRQKDGKKEVLALQTMAERIAALTAERDALKEALKPFAHPDLSKAFANNTQGDDSIIFQRDNAFITLGDCRRAAALLLEAK